MKGNLLSNYYSEVGSFRGAIKVKGAWTSTKDLNRINKSTMYRWQGPPSLPIMAAMKLQPVNADKLLPHLALNKQGEIK